MPASPRSRCTTYRSARVFFFQAEDGIRDRTVTGVQTCALPIYQDSKENYRYAMRVVDITSPDKSLMLIKPTRPTDSAGNVGDYLATHNGGQRWHGNESSDQYQTILEWIRGGRLEDASLRK